MLHAPPTPLTPHPCTKVILRAYLRFRDFKRFQACKEAWELGQSQEIVEDLEADTLMINDDMDEVSKDIKEQHKIINMAQTRAKELTNYNNEAELRQVSCI